LASNPHPHDDGFGFLRRSLTTTLTVTNTLSLTYHQYLIISIDNMTGVRLQYRRRNPYVLLQGHEILDTIAQFNA
jgi:hypothetical protein